MKKTLLILVSIVLLISKAYAQDTIQLSSNLILIRTCENYIIDYIPTNDVTTLLEYMGDDYYRISLPESRYVHYTEDEGYPELPILSITLQAPDAGCTPSLSYQVSNMNTRNGSSDIATSQPTRLTDNCYFFENGYRYYPTTVCDGENPCVSAYNGDYFNDDTWMAEWCYIDSEPQKFMTFHSVTINIIPYHYIYDSNCIQELGYTRFYISFNDNYNLCAMRQETFNTEVWGIDALQYFDNYTTNEAALYTYESFPFVEYPDPYDNYQYTTLNCGFRGDYLIISESRFEDYIENFKAHKIRYGYHVNVEYLVASPLVTSDSIRAIIRNAKEQNNYLKYVLLVGSMSAIPPSYTDTTSNDNQPTDIFYSIFTNYLIPDWHLCPELYVGRWIVDDVSSLQAIINKTIITEFLNTYSKVVLFSGIGNGEQQFVKSNAEISAMLSNYYINNTSILGQSGTAYNSLIGELQNPNVLIWSSHVHGNEVLIGNPYYMDYNTFIDNSIFSPFGFSLGCSNNPFLSEGLGQMLLTASENYGSTVFYGASTISYIESNSKLRKQVFSMLEKPNNLTVGQFFISGARKYYDAWRLSGMKQREMKIFNIAGDPSLFLYGLNQYTGEENESPIRRNLMHSSDISKVKYHDGYLTSSDKEVVSCSVYDYSGILIEKSYSAYVGTLANGLYIIVATLDDGSSVTEKLLINK